MNVKHNGNFLSHAIFENGFKVIIYQITSINQNLYSDLRDFYSTNILSNEMKWNEHQLSSFVRLFVSVCIWVDDIYEIETCWCACIKCEKRVPFWRMKRVRVAQGTLLIWLLGQFPHLTYWLRVCDAKCVSVKNTIQRWREREKRDHDCGKNGSISFGIATNINCVSAAVESLHFALLWFR